MSGHKRRNEDDIFEGGTLSILPSPSRNVDKRQAFAPGKKKEIKKNHPRYQKAYYKIL